MVYHLHLQPSEIDGLSGDRVEQAIAAIRQIREEIRKENARNGG